MRPSLDTYLPRETPDHVDPPLPASAWALALLVMALVVGYFAALFPYEHRHPIDVVDVFREMANFLGVLLVGAWARRDIKILNVGFVSLMISLWMEVIDEFTAEPLWQGTIVPAMLGIGGIVMVAVGVREARRRRAEEARNRLAAEEALRHSLGTLKAVVESTPDAVWVKDKHSRFMLANSAFAALLGHTEEEIVGRSEPELFASAPDSAGRAYARALESGAAERFEATVTDVGDEPHTFLVSRSAFKDHTGRTIGVLGVARDISDRKAVEERLMRQAHHDALTGLANRASFADHLGRAINRSATWQRR